MVGLVISKWCNWIDQRDSINCWAIGGHGGLPDEFSCQWWAWIDCTVSWMIVQFVMTKLGIGKNLFYFGYLIDSIDVPQI